MSKDHRRKVGTVLTLILTVSLIVNTALGSLQIYRETFKSSMMDPATGGESLQVHAVTSSGRPPTPLHVLLHAMTGWVTTWYSGGTPVQNATVGASIQVTGTNVGSIATVDYYVLGEDTGGAGSPYKFLSENSTQVSVGGSSLQLSNRTTIDTHLAAMGLNTTESHTVDYYVYVKVTATGTISGDTITSEIPVTRFDTVTYTYGAHVTLEGGPHSNAQTFALYGSLYTDATYFLIMYGRESGFLAYPAGSTYYPIPAGATITDAHVSLHAYDVVSGDPDVVVRAEARGLPSDGQCTSSSDYWGRSRTTSSVTWNSWPTTVTWADSPDVTDLIQEVVDDESWNGSDRCIQIFFENSVSGGVWFEYYNYRHGGEAKSPKLYITYLSYSASWYPVPPLSLVSLPISLDLASVAAVIVAAVAVFRELVKRRNKR